MSDSPLTYKVALSVLKRVDAPLLRAMEDAGVTPEEFMTLDMAGLSRRLGLSRGSAFESMDRDAALFRAREEVMNLEKHGIKGISLLDSDFPVRLLQAPDAPTMIFQLGETDLDSPHIVSIVGTRRPSPYGIEFCNRLISDLSAYFPDLVVVSGLAYGIDAAAHAASLANNVATVGVLAHGLNMIYPAAHRDLAREILQKGGSLVSEYQFGEKPYRQRFLERNRIVAALSDVVVVVESDIKGGAMSTANTAFSYSREVMAVPGRISDPLSTGCNHLIRKDKARLITCAADLMEIMDWKPLDLNVDVSNRNLFPELDGEPRQVYETLRFSSDPITADTLHSLTLIPMSRLLPVLGEMEFDGIIIRHPGNRYSLA